LYLPSARYIISKNSVSNKKFRFQQRKNQFLFTISTLHSFVGTLERWNKKIASIKRKKFYLKNK
jgi:hypothetical protein